MKLTADVPRAHNLVTAYTAQTVRLGEQTLVASTLVTAERLVAWPVARLEDLDGAALEQVLALEPELVLLATGDRVLFPSPYLMSYLPSRSVGFEVMPTGAACRTYNLLVAEDRRVALALILG